MDPRRLIATRLRSFTTTATATACGASCCYQRRATRERAP